MNLTPGMGGSTWPGVKGPEIEIDDFMPDQNHVQQAMNVANRIQGFFPSFRKTIKDQAILTAFGKAIDQGLPTGGGTPFNINRPQNYLNDEVQEFIAKSVNMPFDQVEVYCNPLKMHFMDIYQKRHQSWDGNVDHPTFPEMN